MVRAVDNHQMQIGQVDISKIRIDPKSRDDIPQILRGLQYIYITQPIREKVFALLEKHVAPNISKSNGRPGMELWKIFVLGVLRLDLNCDYDRLQSLVNSHIEIRQMLGHADFFDQHYYELQTIKDNVSLLSVELLNDINEVVVHAGHALVKKKKNKRCMGGATALSLRLMFIIQPILIYCLMPCVK